MYKLIKNKKLFAATATLFVAASFYNLRDSDGTEQYSMPRMPLNEQAPIELKGGPAVPAKVPVNEATGQSDVAKATTSDTRS